MVHNKGNGWESERHTYCILQLIQKFFIKMVKEDKSMVKTSLIIASSVFLLLIFGCKMQVDNIQSGDKGVEDARGVISFKGKIVYRNFEGGFWGIISDDDQRYDPLVLPEQFQIEGLRVAGKVRRRNVAHFHMWGTIVDLIELKIIEDGVSPAIKELIDGFTYQLKDGKVVRLIGINSGINAQESAELLKKNKLTNSSVKLEFDEMQTDDQSRLLAYVFVDLFCQGGASSILVHGMEVAHFIPHVETVFLNEMLIKAGYAKFESQPPNVKYNKRFRKARNEAASKKRGLWQNEQSIKHGTVEEYFGSGDIMSSIRYEYGMKHGEALWFNMNGEPSGYCQYKDGKEVGICRWYYENGQIQEEHGYDDGILEGLSREWYENGRLEREGRMKQGKRDGVWTFYDKKGGVIAKGHYQNGMPIDGTFIRHLKGNIDRLHTYKDGELIEELELDWKKTVEGENQKKGQ